MTTSDIWTVMASASAVRRYRQDPVDDAVLQRCLTAATWAPSGANQQPWRFVVLRSPETRAAVSKGARRAWEAMVAFYKLEVPSEDAADPKSRGLRAVWEHTHVGGDAPVCILFCIKPQRGTGDLQQGASIFPAVQNFLLAARAVGLGAAVTLWHESCESELRALVGIPEDWRIATLVTAGWPRGSHHKVRRKPVEDVVVVDQWDRHWAPDMRVRAASTSVDEAGAQRS
ncbi:nitroreductase family protein [Mycobacterium sp. IS-3022]|uniref:nitroreductase family protein n=1 Tax=Mycobacterium sp. IS-3022 TaxID=1772277 RepID=UPI0007416172|nr:nitroreductase family protein [Mycobacterium sp. IS-3022]KUI04748.1 nitroreductase [Mycobacterium sp. IS-3022]